MPPLVIPPLVKIALGVLGAGAIVHWVVKEVRRINAELDRVKTASRHRSGRPQGAADLTPRPEQR